MNKFLKSIHSGLPSSFTTIPTYSVGDKLIIVSSGEFNAFFINYYNKLPPWQHFHTDGVGDREAEVQYILMCDINEHLENIQT